MDLIRTVTHLIESTAADLGLEIILVKVEKTRRVRCIIDRDPEGITLEDCTRLSRAVSRALDEVALDAGSFHVEVMSPGENRCLTRDKDYTRFQGSRVRVTLVKKTDGRRNFTGTLKGLDLEDDAVVLEEEETGEERAIPRQGIKEVRLSPEA